MRASRILNFWRPRLPSCGPGTVGFTTLRMAVVRRFLHGHHYPDHDGYEEVIPVACGRVFNIVIILSGVSLLFLLIGSLTQALLEFELQSFFGRRRMERDIDV